MPVPPPLRRRCRPRRPAPRCCAPADAVAAAVRGAWFAGRSASCARTSWPRSPSSAIPAALGGRARWRSTTLAERGRGRRGHAPARAARRRARGLRPPRPPRPLPADPHRRATCDPTRRARWTRGSATWRSRRPARAFAELPGLGPHRRAGLPPRARHDRLGLVRRRTRTRRRCSRPPCATSPPSTRPTSPARRCGRTAGTVCDVAGGTGELLAAVARPAPGAARRARRPPGRARRGARAARRRRPHDLRRRRPVQRHRRRRPTSTSSRTSSTTGTTPPARASSATVRGGDARRRAAARHRAAPARGPRRTRSPRPPTSSMLTQTDGGRERSAAQLQALLARRRPARRARRARRRPRASSRRRLGGVGEGLAGEPGAEVGDADPVIAARASRVAEPMCGRTSRFGASSSGSSGGQRLGVGDVEPGAAEVAGAQRARAARPVDQRPARGVDQQRARLHRAQALDRSARASRRSAARGGETTSAPASAACEVVVAPGVRDLHPEALAAPADRAPDASRPDHQQRLARQPHAEPARRLERPPVARSHRATASGSRRATARISAQARSAVASVSTSGVRPTAMPRAAHASRSMLSVPTA